MPSLRYARLRCISTVLTVMNRLLRDLRIAAAARGQLGDPQLARRQLVDARTVADRDAGTGGGELPPRELRQRARGTRVGEFQARLEGLARVAPAVCTTQRGAEIDERPRPPEPGGRALERLGGRLKLVEVRTQEARHAQRSADRARALPALGRGERLVGDPQRALTLAHRVQRQREVEAGVEPDDALGPGVAEALHRLREVADGR